MGKITFNLDAKLTPREEQIVGHMVYGYADKEIADMLNISYNTVRNERYNAFAKMGVQKVTEACKWFYCKNYNIDIDSLRVKCKVMAVVMLMALIPKEIITTGDYFRVPSRAARCARRCRKPENDLTGLQLL